jgi:serine/threonine protein kinase
MPLGPGEPFGGYTIVRLLGSGGMGEVYLAEHPRLPRRDALKILSADVSADPDFRARFNREADLAATLFHPHIVGVHDRGEFDGQLWIAMDYVEGTDAGQLMRDQYPAGMPARDVCAIVTAVAGALDYAHQRGLLHRDVKPANILLANPEDAATSRPLRQASRSWASLSRNAFNAAKVWDPSRMKCRRAKSPWVVAGQRQPRMHRGHFVGTIWAQLQLTLCGVTVMYFSS